MTLAADCQNVPIPPAIKDYNKHMGGVDLSDALIGFYQVLHKPGSGTNLLLSFYGHCHRQRFIIYKEHCKVSNSTPMAQKSFRHTLIFELEAEANRLNQTQDKGDRVPVIKTHRLVHITSEGGMTSGRLKCRKCHVNKTAVKCFTCDTPLCFQQQRDCYYECMQKEA
ncbi:hypothetical protein WMY93_011345 [Mugilogobius chulae]|uniref:PiggyBac transposable element-derived protein domain-containing protein n=1 Tax=Mugilogobius chulae TaxID=88201 RepID=A0AAW0PCB6_9GOBI